MPDRLEIKISAELPSLGYYKVLADAEIAAKVLVETLNKDHGLTLTVEVKSVTPQAPRKRTTVASAPAVQPDEEVPQMPALRSHAHAAD